MSSRGIGGISVGGVAIAVRNLVHRIESRMRRAFGLGASWTTGTLLGKDLVVREGTIPREADYDDAWLHACSRHAEVVFDVGANIGQSALLVLLSGPVREVVLVEANRDALAIAADNLIRNQLSARARFVEAFASDASNDTISLWTVGTGAAGSMYEGHAVTAARAGKSQRVRTVTLDELAARYGLAPDLVKVDVEGAEAKVLVGSREIMTRRRTRFLVEMHSPSELPMQRNADLVLAWAASGSYACWYLAEGTRLERGETIAHRGRCHLLIQPAEWAFPEWLVGIGQSAPLPDTSR